jgi:16S rRNA processing protein RimM
VPGASMLVIEGPHGEVLVPLAEDICRVIDPAAGRIVIDPPAGLLELNAPPATPRAARRGKGRTPR